MQLASLVKWFTKKRRLGNFQPNMSWMSRTAACLFEPVMYTLFLSRLTSWPTSFRSHLKPNLQQSSNSDSFAGGECGKSD